MSQPRAILHRDSHQVRLILSAQQLEADASTALIQTLPNAHDLDPDQGLLKHVPARSLRPQLSPSCLRFVCVIFLRHSFELSLLSQAMFTERTMCQVQGIKICYIVSELQVFAF